MPVTQSPVYPTQPEALRQHLADLLRQAPPAEGVEGDLRALIVPDSNRLSGGEAAARAYRLLEGQAFDTVLVVSPSNTGAFGRLSICRTDVYRTPLGDIPVNDALRNELCDEDDDIFLDDTGHYHTEGADVQLPFLQQALDEGFSVVPVVMGEETPAFCRELGQAIGEVMYGRRALLVASADVLDADAEGLARVREALERLDVPELLHLLGSETIKVEGMGAAIVAVIAAQARGANRAVVLEATLPEGDQPGALACALLRA